MRWSIVAGVWLLAGSAWAQAGTGTGTRYPPVEPVVLDQLSLSEILDVDRRVTTATRSVAVSLDDAPSIVTVITREQIRAFGYRTVPEALASVPGLFLVNDLTTDNLAIRGIHAGVDSWSRMAKFMIDGMPVQYGPTGGALLGPEFVPIQAVERIEIVRGPASALYGANALLGVVNVITTRPTAAGVTSAVELEGVLNRSHPGAGGGLHVSAQSSGRRPVWARVSVYGERLDRSGLSLPAGSPAADEFEGRSSDGDTTLPASLLARAGIDGGPLGEVTVESSLQHLRAHTAFGQTSTLVQRNLTAKLNSVSRLDYRLPLFSDWHLGPDLRQRMRLHAWGSLAHARSLPVERFVTNTGAVQRRRRQTTTEVGIETAYEIGRHSAVVGLDFQHLHTPGEAIYDLDPGSDAGTRRAQDVPIAFDNAAVFGQLIAYPLSFLGLTGSLRYDRGDLVGEALSYRVAGVLRPIDMLTIKTVAGSSFVPPALSQLYAAPLTLAGGVVGNPDLRTQRADTLELALTLLPAPGLRFGLTGYRTRVADRVEMVPGGALFVAENQTDSVTLGLELEGEYVNGDVRIEGSLSLQDTELAAPPLRNYRWDTVYGVDRASANFPEWLAQLRAYWALPDSLFELAVSSLFVGKRKSTTENILMNGGLYYLPATAVLGLQLSTRDFRPWQPRETRVSLHVEDLFGTGYVSGGTLGADIPALGRRVYLRVLQEL